MASGCMRVFYGRGTGKFNYNYKLAINGIGMGIEMFWFRYFTFLFYLLLVDEKGILDSFKTMQDTFNLRPVGSLQGTQVLVISLALNP